MKNRVHWGKLTFWGLIMVALASLLLTACSSSTTSTAPTSKASTTAAASPTAAATAKPSAAPQTGGTLRVGINRDAVFLGDPVEITQQQDSIMCRPAMETLARYDETGKLQPWLATGWETNADALTMTVKLRTGVKFHDGTEFNADAAKFNLERFMASKRNELANVKSVEVIDPSTIKLNLKSWDSTIDGAVLYFAGNMMSPKAFQTNSKAWAEKNPVGTGPFKFASWERDSSIKYQKNPDYWQKGQPYLDKIEFTIIADPMVRVAALDRREIDIIESPENKDLAMFRSSGKYYVGALNTAPSGFYTCIPDSLHADSPFSNIKVRQAAYAAIDRQAIVNTILSGNGQPATQYADPTSWGYNPAVKGFAYDVNKAKQLLTEGGYPNGFKCTIYGKNNAQDMQIQAAVQGYFAKIGITAEVTSLSETMFNDISGNKGWTNAVNLIGLRGGPDPALLIPRYYGPQGKPAWLTSVIRPPDALQAMTDAIAAKTFAAKQEATQRIMSTLYGDTNLVSIPIYQDLRYVVKYPNIHDDGMYIADMSIWTPETAWLSK
jgi:peptide/nickel transport system substrate-binding protein